MKHRIFAYLGLVSIAAIWGINYAVSRWGMGLFDPVLFTFLRFGLAVPFFFLILKLKEKNVGVDKSDILKLMLIGLFGVTVLEISVMYSIKYTTLANSSLLTVAPWPIFTALLSPLFTRERITSRLVVSGGFALVGVCLIILGGGASLSMQSEYMLGNLLALGVSFLGALYNLSCMPLMQKYSPLRVSSWYMLFGAAFMFPLTLTSWGKVNWPALGAVDWLSIAYNVFPSTLIAFVGWNASMKMIGAARANFFRYTVPAVAAVSGFLFFKETFALWQLAGGLLILGALAAISMEKEGALQSDAAGVVATES